MLADAAGRRDAWAKALEGWEMKESAVLKEWEARGVSKGRRDTRVAALLEVLTTRFTTVPADLVDAIRRTQDPDQLAACLKTAVLADSLEAFRAATGL